MPEGNDSGAVRRLKQFYMAGNASSAEGWYDPRTHLRDVAIGSDPRSTDARLAALHETMHSYLNSTTGFGSCMSLAGGLARRGEDGFEPLVTYLLQGAVLCHEAFATATSTFIVGNHRFDGALLEQYPDYIEYFEVWRSLIDAAPHPMLGYIAIVALTRAAMQTGLVTDWTRQPLRDWPETELVGLDNPDERLTTLLSQGFLKTLFRVQPTVQEQEQVWVEALSSGQVDEGAFKSGFATGGFQTIHDAFEKAYFRLAQHRLEAFGGVCLDYNGHMPSTKILIEKIAGEIGSDALPTYRTPRADESYEDVLTSEFALENMLLATAPYPAFFVDVAALEGFDPNDFLIGVGKSKHVHLVTMPKSRLIAQYEFEPESAAEVADWPLDPITILRRRIVNADTGHLDSIEILGIRDPQALGSFAEGFEQLDHVAAVASLQGMQADLWRSNWMPIFESFGTLPIIMDTDPFAMMRQWHRQGQTVKTHRLIMEKPAFDNGEDARRCEIFCWRVEGQDMIFLAPVTAATAAAISHYAGQWPEAFVADATFIEDARTELTFALSHIIQEERMFGFWW